MAPTKKRETRAQLKRKILELEAQGPMQEHFASASLDKYALHKCMASAVILQLSTLGGGNVMPPVAIRDGLSPATIDAIRSDLKRSSLLATAYLAPDWK